MKTQKRHILQMWRNQVKNSRTSGREPPEYSHYDLQQWVLNHPNFINLWNAYVVSGYMKELAPSVDRLNNKQGYSFNNIQLVTWEQNLHNQKTQAMQGVHASGRAFRKVTQCTKEGTVVKIHHSLSSASRELVGHPRMAGAISNAANNNGMSLGYLWKWC